MLDLVFYSMVFLYENHHGREDVGDADSRGFSRIENISVHPRLSASNFLVAAMLHYAFCSGMYRQSPSAVSNRTRPSSSKISR